MHVNTKVVAAAKCISAELTVPTGQVATFLKGGWIQLKVGNHRDRGNRDKGRDKAKQLSVYASQSRLSSMNTFATRNLIVFK